MKGVSDDNLMKLNVREKSFIAKLTTIGRSTGKVHTVHLRFVSYNGKLYASRRSMSGDWLKNVLKNPSVIVEVDGKKVKGKATLVEDKELLKMISSMKYDDERASMERVVVEITPEE